MAGISFSKGSRGRTVEIETSDAHARAIAQLFEHLTIVASEGRETTVAVEVPDEEERRAHPRLLTIPFSDMHNPSFRYSREAISGEGGRARADEYRETYLHWKDTGELVIQGSPVSE